MTEHDPHGGSPHADGVRPMAPPPPPPPPGLFPNPPVPRAPSLAEKPARGRGTSASTAAQPAETGGDADTATASRPPARKRNTVAITLIAVGVTLCGLLGIAAIVIGVGLGGLGDRIAASQAEKHMSVAVVTVRDAGKSLDALDIRATDAAVTRAAVASATTAMHSVRDELAAAKVAIDRAKDSQGKTDYLSAITAATHANDALQDLITYASTASSTLDILIQASNVTRRANEELSTAIAAGNRSDWATMKSEATAASRDYAKGAMLFADATAIDSSAGLDLATAYCSRRRQQADVVARMADEGRRGQRAAYADDAKHSDSLGRQAEGSGAPGIVSDPDWARKRLDAFEQRINQQAGLADALRKKALQELGSSR
jgi:hypothetical protein